MSDSPAAPDTTARESARELTVPYRVRFDESTPAGQVRASALLRYAQDVAWIHSESLGYDRAWYAARGWWWLVRSVELRLEREIALGTTLRVRTEVGGFRKVWARRRTEVTLPDGTLAAWLHTDWVLIDGRGAPVRIPDTFPARFAAPPGAFEPVRVALPAAPDDAATAELAVRPHELDPMDHVNNAVYLDHVEDAIDAAGGADDLACLPRTVRLEYLVPAAAGDRLIARTWRTGDGWAVRLAMASGGEVLRAVVAD